MLKSLCPSILHAWIACLAGFEKLFQSACKRTLHLATQTAFRELPMSLLIPLFSIKLSYK